MKQTRYALYAHTITNRLRFTLWVPTHESLSVSYAHRSLATLGPSTIYPFGTVRDRDSTTRSTQGCEGRGSRLRLRLDSTTNSTRGFDGPRSWPAPLHRLHGHPPKLNSHLVEWSHVCIHWVLSGSGGSIYGRSTDADLFKEALGDCSHARDARA